MASESNGQDWQTLTLDWAGVTIEHPSDWTAAEGILGTALAIVGPEHEPGAFRSNLNLVVLDAPGPGNVEELVDPLVAELREALEDPHVLEASASELAGHPAARVLVAYNDRGAELTLEQWVVPRPEHRQVWSATAATADLAVDAPRLHEILDSLSIADA